MCLTVRLDFFNGAQLVDSLTIESVGIVEELEIPVTLEVSDQINISSTSSQSIDVSILNALGQELKSFTLSAECAKSWKPYSSGIYLVSIKGSSFSKTEKVLVK